MSDQSQPPALAEIRGRAEAEPDDHIEPCPDCGLNRSDNSLHQSDCPRIDTPLQFGPPWLPWLCKHCGQAIVFGTSAWAHAAHNGERGLQRCNPADSGEPYGLNADPVGASCSGACREAIQ